MAHEHVGTKTLWAGRAVSAIPVGILLMSGAFKLSAALAGNEEMLRNWGKSGYPASTLLPIAIVEIACAILYAVPATAVLGAVWSRATWGARWRRTFASVSLPSSGRSSSASWPGWGCTCATRASARSSR